LIKRIIISILFLLIACYFIQAFYNISLRNSSVGICQKFNEIFEGNNNYDLVYFGSSRAAFHFDPSKINLGDTILQYNSGISGIETVVTESVIKSFLSSHDYKPKYAVVNFDFFFWKRIHNGIQAGYARFFPYLNNDILYNSVFQMDKRFFFFKYFSPYTMVHLNDSKYHDWYRFSTGNKIAIDEDYMINGFETYLKTTQDRFFVLDSLNPSLNREYEIESAKKIFQFFRNNNIKLIPVISPFYFENRQEVMGDSTHFKILQDLCDQYNTPLLNYFDLEINNDKSNFYDELHLNLKGVNKFSKKLEADLIDVIMD
jgi:hypothetical protein